MQAIIYQAAKNAMQSGRGKAGHWLLEFDQAAARQVDPLMGWTSSSDMRQQLQMQFDSEEQAVAYCRRHGIPYRIRKPTTRKIRTKSYADNFSFYKERGPGTRPLPQD